MEVEHPPCALLSLPDELQSIILAALGHEDLASLAKTCWTAANRVMKLAPHARPVVDITSTGSTQPCIGLLQGYQRHDVLLRLTGESAHIKQQLTAMQQIATCISALHITLETQHENMTDDDGEKLSQELYPELRDTLSSLTSYTSLTQLGVAVVYQPDAVPSTETDATIGPLTDLPAIKDLAVLQRNEAQTMPLLNTLCGTLVPSWQKSIETIRLYNDMSTYNLFLDHLVFNPRPPMVLHELYLPGESTLDVAHYCGLGYLTFAPDPRTETFHIHHLMQPEELDDDDDDDDVDDYVDKYVTVRFWELFIHRVSSEQPYHLHVHAGGDCSNLWRALSNPNITRNIKQLSVTIKEDNEDDIEDLAWAEAWATLIYLTPNIPVIVNVTNPTTYTSGFRRGMSNLAATFRLYCSESEDPKEIKTFCRNLQLDFVSSRVERHVKHGSKWVLDTRDLDAKKKKRSKKEQGSKKKKRSKA